MVFKPLFKVHLSRKCDRPINDSFTLRAHYSTSKGCQNQRIALKGLNNNMFGQNWYFFKLKVKYFLVHLSLCANEMIQWDSDEEYSIVDSFWSLFDVRSWLDGRLVWLCWTPIQFVTSILLRENKVIVTYFFSSYWCIRHASLSSLTYEEL